MWEKRGSTAGRANQPKPTEGRGSLYKRPLKPSWYGVRPDGELQRLLGVERFFEFTKGGLQEE